MRTVTIERAPAELAGRTVADEMVRLPKVLPATLTVSGALEAFEDDHVHMLLLGDRGRLVGTLLRADLPARPSADPVLPYAVLAGRTVGAGLPAETARRLLVARGERRLAVVDRDGTLLGLLCLKGRLTGFCSDADVAARAAGRAGLDAGDPCP